MDTMLEKGNHQTEESQLTDAYPPRIAAVLILQFQRAGESYIVLTKRTENVSTHKGQISLPGGNREPQDATLLETALRETQEEIGIARERLKVIGQLDGVYTAGGNFSISPFIAQLDGPPSFSPYPREVAEVIELPLSIFDEPCLFWEEERIGPGDEPRRRVFFFRYAGHVIWGATARILKDYLVWADRLDPWEKGATGGR